MKQIQCYIYSRVVGYFQPIINWNPGKKSEFADRVTYSLDVIKEALKEGEI
jgi:ribonucleoside-triphosphate reductase (formate)